MATDANKSGVNWDFYNDRPISKRNRLSDLTNHLLTDFCGYDRKNSVCEDRYVCSCGWREPIRPAVFGDTTNCYTVPSTKPTAFQQYLNDHPQPQSNKAKDEPVKARTYDEGKLPLAWLPWAAIDELSKVQQYGHSKYREFNNYRKGMEVTRNLSCALRHIRDYLSGHDIDDESGHNPLAHALCRIAFVLQNIAEGTAIDDRYKPTKPFNPDLEEVIKDSLRSK